jgi:serine/threonine-protein kinase
MRSIHSQIGLVVGDIVSGKYRVDGLLGVGGMGAVLAARHLQLDRRVAIKVLLPDMLDDPEVMARFDREARASVRIKSDHVVKVTEVGTLESGTPYMVMEYLEGEDLDTFLRQKGRLPVDQTVGLMIQTCEVVAQAHKLGIVHRDLKPANLFCVSRPDGTVSIKVLDFGISKLMSEKLTNVRCIVGSPAYMSPEQIQSPSTVDQRADIWALGVVLYELLTGAVPFVARTLPAMLTHIATQPSPSVRAVRPDVPALLDAIIQRCLEKDPQQRYRTATELARALGAFARTRAASKPSTPMLPAVAFARARPSARWIGFAAAMLIVLAGIFGDRAGAPVSASTVSRGVANLSRAGAIPLARWLPALPLPSIRSADVSLSDGINDVGPSGSFCNVAPPAMPLSSERSESGNRPLTSSSDNCR